LSPRQRVKQARGRVEPPAHPGAVAVEGSGADDRHDAVGADHVAVVAQRDDVRARELRVGRERDGDVGEPVVQRLDSGVGIGQLDQVGRGIGVVDLLQARDAIRVGDAVRGRRELERGGLRVRRAGGRADAERGDEGRASPQGGHRSVTLGPEGMIAHPPQWAMRHLSVPLHQSFV
jgi:hypothetical protein